MNLNKTINITIKSKLNQQGPWKVKFENENKSLIGTYKIRKQDEISYEVGLNQGENTCFLLKNEEIFKKKSFFIPNYECGSKIKIEIDENNIEIDLKEVEEYKSINEIMKKIEEKEEKGKEKKKKKKKEKKEGKSEGKLIVNDDLHVKDVLNNEIKENQIDYKENNDYNQENNEENLKEYIKSQTIINKSLQNQIEQLKEEIKYLKNKII